jgi:anti-sigma28 factor (negative regulator of flagellin synthesis)
MKKARKYQEDENELFLPARKSARRPAPQVKQAAPLRREGQLQISDVEVVRHSLESIKARNERVEQLKAQVNAGTYKVDSMALAQKMATAPGVQRLLSVGRYSLLDFGDEE